MFKDAILERLARTALGLGALAVLAGVPSITSAAPKDSVKPPTSMGGPHPDTGLTDIAPTDLPDLVVLIEKISCDWGYLQLKVRLQNTTSNTAQPPFTTTLKMDGIDFPMTPRVTNFALTGGHVFHVTFPAVADGPHDVKLFIDSNQEVPEKFENNNETIELGIPCLDQSTNSQIREPGTASEVERAPAMKPGAEAGPKGDPRGSHSPSATPRE